MALDDVFVGLDAGSVNVRAVIGVSDYSGGEDVLRIVGVGSVPSEGIKNGVIINKEAASACIREAIDEAQQMSGRDVYDIVCGIGGVHIKGENSTGVVSVQSSRRGEKPAITARDIENVMQSACTIPEVPGREICYNAPIEYKVDNSSGIKDPHGVLGSRLEIKAHIITVSSSAVNNLRSCISSSDYAVQHIYPITLADSVSVLDSEEEKGGVLVIDIGGSTADVGFQMDGATYFTGVVPIGGRHVTGDLAVVLKLPADVAEEIKLKYGCCARSPESEWERVTLPASSGIWSDRSISEKEIYEIIRARMWEILTEAKRIALVGGVKDLAGGVVITGGGSMIPGVCDLAGEVFGVPARIGYPKDLIGDKKLFDSPLYAGAVGLAKIAFDQRDRGKRRSDLDAYKGDFVSLRQNSDKKDGGAFKDKAKKFWATLKDRLF